MVAGLHVALFAVSSLREPPVPVLVDPPISVQLVRPTPPPPPPPPPEPPAPDAGGGAPAAPSVVRVSPRPVPRPEVVAPPKPAPALALIVGVSDKAGPTPGQGQGGQGTGTGDGEGEGDGPGSGSGALILRGATNGEILPFVPPEARRRRVAGEAAVRCIVRLDTRLEACRAVSETPPGLGFGEAAARVAEAHFRVRPPMTASGRPIAGQTFTAGVLFGRQGGR